MDNSNYERIGSKLALKWSGLPNGSPEKESLGKFIDVYGKAPMFLVGFSSEEMEKSISPDIELNSEFHLPFPTMLLDFPEADYLAASVGTSPLIYLTTTDTGYFAEVLNYTMYQKQDKRKMGSNWSPVQSTLSVLCSFAFRLYPQVEITFNNANNDECDKERSIVYDDIVKIDTFKVCNNCEHITSYCESLSAVTPAFLSLIIKAVEYINEPQMYVIKETPEMTSSERRRAEKGNMPYFGKKPRHIVLDHSQVKEIIQRSSAPGSTERHVMPHERKGHWRRLRAERFIEKKKVWVRPADINRGMQWTHESRVYEVIR